jgi:hypothetical protein
MMLTVLTQKPPFSTGDLRLTLVPLQQRRRLDLGPPLRPLHARSKLWAMACETALWPAGTSR